VKRILLLAAAAVLALAACTTTATTAAPPPHSGTATTPAGTAAPSAMSLAQKITGATGCQAATPDPTSTGDVTCTLPDGSQLELATFTTSADETQWIRDGGTGLPPDPSYAGCCIQGSGWAATVGAPAYVVRGSVPVIAALGGRVVTG
jgi:hypothetical protein